MKKKFKNLGKILWTHTAMDPDRQSQLIGEEFFPLDVTRDELMVEKVQYFHIQRLVQHII